MKGKKKEKRKIRTLLTKCSRKKKRKEKNWFAREIQFQKGVIRIINLESFTTGLPPLPPLVPQCHGILSNKKKKRLKKIFFHSS